MPGSSLHRQLFDALAECLAATTDATENGKNTMRNKLVITAEATTQFVVALGLTALMWVGLRSNSRSVIWLTLTTGSSSSRIVEWGCWVLIAPVMLWQIWRISAVIAAWVFRHAAKPNATV